MKKFSKVLVVALVSLLMVFSVVSTASAAVTYKDGTYVGVNEGSVTYKLNVTVAGGVITEAHLQLFYGTTELTSAVAQVKSIFDSWEKMCDELVKSNDASLVKSADDAFKACAADFEKQAGKATADDAATTTEDTATEDAAPAEDTVAEDTTAEDTAVEEDVEEVTEEDATVEEDVEEVAEEDVEEVAEEDATVEEDTTEEATEETAATSDSSIPKTGVVGLGLVYGLGAIATGAYALKRKER